VQFFIDNQAEVDAGDAFYEDFRGGVGRRGGVAEAIVLDFDLAVVSAHGKAQVEGSQVIVQIVLCPS
jgi:hypothetical protein